MLYRKGIQLAAVLAALSTVTATAVPAAGSDIAARGLGYSDNIPSTKADPKSKNNGIIPGFIYGKSGPNKSGSYGGNDSGSDNDSDSGNDSDGYASGYHTDKAGKKLWRHHKFGKKYTVSKYTQDPSKKPTKPTYGSDSDSDSGNDSDGYASGYNTDRSGKRVWRHHKFGKKYTKVTLALHGGRNKDVQYGKDPRIVGKLTTPTYGSDSGSDSDYDGYASGYNTDRSGKRVWRHHKFGKKYTKVTLALHGGNNKPTRPTYGSDSDSDSDYDGYASGYNTDRSGKRVWRHHKFGKKYTKVTLALHGGRNKGTQYGKDPRRTNDYDSDNDSDGYASGYATDKKTGKKHWRHHRDGKKFYKGVQKYTKPSKNGKPVNNYSDNDSDSDSELDGYGSGYRTDHNTGKKVWKVRKYGRKYTVAKYSKVPRHTKPAAGYGSDPDSDSDSDSDSDGYASGYATDKKSGKKFWRHHKIGRKYTKYTPAHFGGNKGGYRKGVYDPKPKPKKTRKSGGPPYGSGSDSDSDSDFEYVPGKWVKKPHHVTRPYPGYPGKNNAYDEPKKGGHWFNGKWVPYHKNDDSWTGNPFDKKSSSNSYGY